MAPILVVVLRACLALACLALAAAGRHLGGQPLRSSDDGNFDFFYLVRQWPGNYCGEHSCPQLHDGGSYHFTIHGLWPNYKAGGWPQDCDPDYKFDERDIDNLEGALEQEWPSFMGADDTFWEHEWSKHGTCALNVLGSEHKYFKAVLKLHWKYNLGAAFKRAGIYPDPSTVYDTQELVHAVEHMFGARPLVHCYDGKLSEVWMCIGKDLRAFDCKRPASTESGSGPVLSGSGQCSQLTIPPLPKTQKPAVVPLAGLEADSDLPYGEDIQAAGEAQAELAAGQGQGLLVLHEPGRGGQRPEAVADAWEGVPGSSQQQRHETGPPHHHHLGAAAAAHGAEWFAAAWHAGPAAALALVGLMALAAVAAVAGVRLARSSGRRCCCRCRAPGQEGAAQEVEGEKQAAAADELRAPLLAAAKPVPDLMP